MQGPRGRGRLLQGRIGAGAGLRRKKNGNSRSISAGGRCGLPLCSFLLRSLLRYPSPLALKIASLSGQARAEAAAATAARATAAGLLASVRTQLLSIKEEMDWVRSAAVSLALSVAPPPAAGVPPQAPGDAPPASADAAAAVAVPLPLPRNPLALVGAAVAKLSSEHEALKGRFAAEVCPERDGWHVAAAYRVPPNVCFYALLRTHQFGSSPPSSLLLVCLLWPPPRPARAAS